MGLRFRKSIKVLPGVKLNISKSGISTSVGRRGATVNFSKRGTRATVGIPGTGISYSTMVGKRKSGSRKSSTKSTKTLRNELMQEYGLTNAEMNRFEKQVKKHPRKFRSMSEEELVEYAKKGKKSSGSKTILYVILAIILIGSIGRHSTNKQPQNDPVPKTIVNRSSSTESPSTEKPTMEPVIVKLESAEPTQEIQIVEETIVTDMPTLEPAIVKLENVEPTQEIKNTEKSIATDIPTVKNEIMSDSVIKQENYKTSKDDTDYQNDELITFVDASYLKGRGLVDISGIEPNYINAIGFATVYSNNKLEGDSNSINTPWDVPVFQKTNSGWEIIDTIEHKSKIGIISQELTKKNGKEYQGYLEFQEIETGKRGYINVINFITVPYWDLEISESVEKGYGIATFKQKSKYSPALKDGKPAKIKNNTQVLLPAKGTYYVSIMDRVHYQILGIIFETKDKKVEPQYIFFNKKDLSIDY